jgi:guanylate kinase
MNSTGILFVLCAPSGTGKSTLVRRLVAECPNFAFSVSCTTRAPRPGERDGVDYHFLSREEFLRRREAGFFAEWAEVHGNLYGTPKAATLELLAQGRDVLFDIDVQGARQLRASLGAGAYVFLFPPSPQELHSRLTRRGTEDAETLARRMAAAKEEIAHSPEFDYWIVNDDLEGAYQRLKAVYLAEKCRPRYQEAWQRTVWNTWGLP